MITDDELKNKFSKLWPCLNERSRRLIAASEAIGLGFGGISRVSLACGLSRVTITKGIKELESDLTNVDRIRNKGGGRHPITTSDSEISNALESIIDSSSRGDPESPLRLSLIHI